VENAMSWRESSNDKTYGDEEVEQRLKEELPHWF